MSEIYYEYFEKKYDIYREKQKNSSNNLLDEINFLGEKAIHYYNILCSYLELEFQNTNEKTIEDLNTLIMIKINLAKISSKLIYKDSKKTLQYMKNSLTLYKESYNIISNLISNISVNETLKNQYKLCEEMINLIPMKIAKFSNN